MRPSADTPDEFRTTRRWNPSPAEHEQATNALELLKPYGISLNEVVQDWIARKKAAEASITYEAAMDAFLDWRKRSESYTRSIRQTRNRLAGLHGKMLNTITTADLTRSMDGMPPSVRNFTIRILGGLFNFGAKRGFCDDNPVRRLDLSQRDPTEIQLHTVEEVGRSHGGSGKARRWARSVPCDLLLRRYPASGSPTA